MEKCPCHSHKLYKECCEPYHQGAAPESALLLMRSRYAAYALNLGSYIIETTHPSSPYFLPDKLRWLKEIEAFAKRTQFKGLTILDHQEGEHESYVTFVAFLQQDGKDSTFTEKSRFKKEQGHWLYCEGKLAKGCLTAEQAKKL